MANKSVSEILREEAERQEKEKLNAKYNDWQKVWHGISEFGENMSGNLLRTYEGVVDFGGNAVAWLGDKLGANTKGITDFTKRDLVGELQNQDWYKKASYGLWTRDWMYGMSYKDYSKLSNTNQFLPSIAQEVAGGIGTTLGNLTMASALSGASEAVGSLGTAGQASGNLAKAGAFAVENSGMFASVAGSSSTQALQEGANLDQAMLYGSLSGALEVAVENYVDSAIGGIKTKIGGTDLVSKVGQTKMASALTNRLANQLGATTAKNLLSTAMSEGIEEVVSGVIDPIFKTITYDNQAYKQYGTNEFYNELGHSFLIGALSAGVSGGAQATLGIATKGLKGYETQLRLQAVAETNIEMMELYQEGGFYTVDGNGQLIESEEARKLVEKKAKQFEELGKVATEYLQTIANMSEEERANIRGAQDLWEYFEEQVSFRPENETRARIEQLNNELGIKTEFVDTYSTDENGKSTRNYSNYDDNSKTMTLTKNALVNPETAFKEYFSHEVGHKALESLKKSDRASFKALVDNLKGKVTEKEYNKYREAYANALNESSQVEEDTKRYIQEGMTAQEAINQAQLDYLDEEIACDNMRKYFKNLDSFERFVKTLNKKEKLSLLDRLVELFEGRKKPNNWKKVRELLREGYTTNESEDNADIRYKLTEEDINTLNTTEDYDTLKGLADKSEGVEETQKVLNRLNELVRKLAKDTSRREEQKKLFALANEMKAKINALKNASSGATDKKETPKEEPKTDFTDRLNKANTEEELTALQNEIRQERVKLASNGKPITELVKLGSQVENKLAKLKASNQEQVNNTSVEEKAKEEPKTEPKTEVKQDSKKETKERVSSWAKTREKYPVDMVEANSLENVHKAIQKSGVAVLANNISDSKIEKGGRNFQNIYKKMYEAYVNTLIEIDDLALAQTSKNYNTIFTMELDKLQKPIEEKEKLLARNGINVESVKREVLAKHNRRIERVNGIDVLMPIEQKNTETKPIEQPKKVEEPKKVEKPKAETKTVEKVVNKLIKSNVIRKEQSAYTFREEGLTYYTEASAEKLLKFTKALLEAQVKEDEDYLVGLKLYFDDGGRELNKADIVKAMNSKRADSVEVIMNKIRDGIKMQTTNEKGQTVLVDFRTWAIENGFERISSYLDDTIKNYLGGILHSQMKLGHEADFILNIQERYLKKIDYLFHNNKILKERYDNAVAKINSLKEEVKQTKVEANKEIKQAKSEAKTANKKVEKLVDATIKAKSETGVIKVQSDIKEILNDYQEVYDAKFSDTEIIKIATDVSNLKFKEASEKIVANIETKELVDGITYKDYLNDLERAEMVDNISKALEEYAEGKDLSYLSKQLLKMQEKTDKVVREKEKILTKNKADRLAKTEQRLRKKLEKREFGKHQPPQLIETYLDLYDTKSKDIINGDIREKLVKWKKAYTDTLEETGLPINEMVLEDIDNLIKTEGKLSMSDLEVYNNVLKGINHHLEVLHDIRKIKISGVEQTFSEVKSKSIIAQQNASRDSINLIDQTASPFVILDKLDGYDDNGIWHQTYNDIYDGIDRAYLLKTEWLKPFEEFSKKNKKFMKSLEKTVTVNGIEMTKDKALYDLMVSKDTDGRQDLMYKGTHGNKGLHTFEIEYDDEGVAFSTELDNYIEELEQMFSDKQSQEFMKLTRAFFDEVGKTKKATDEELFGYSNVRKDANYIHLVINTDNKATEIGSVEMFKNKKMADPNEVGSNKSRSGAKGSIANVGLTYVIDKISGQQSMYNGLAVPIDNLNQVMNSKDENGISVLQVTKERMGYDKKGNVDSTKKARVSNFLLELTDNATGRKKGKVEIESAIDNAINFIRGGYSAAVLGTNPKVAFMQPTSIVAGWKYLDIKATIKALFNTNMKDYPPLPPYAVRRIENNGYVVAESNTTIDGKIGKFRKAATWGNSVLDNYATKLLWRASCIQFTENGVVNVEKATDLFNRVMRETQPNFDRYGRGQFQNSNHQMIKFLTQFKSQVFQNYSNMITETRRIAYKKKNGTLTNEDVKRYSKVVGGFALQNGLVVLMNALFAFMLDHDKKDEFEAETLLENYLNKVTLGSIPFLSDIQIDFDSKTKIKINDMNLSSLSALTEIGSTIDALTSDTRTTESKIKVLAYQISNVIGIPTKNIYKYLSAIPRNANNQDFLEFDAKWNNIKNNSSSINNALKENNTQKAKVYYKAHQDSIIKLDDKTTNELFRLYSNGYNNVIAKAIPDKVTNDGYEYTLTAKDKQVYKNNYTKLKTALESLTNSYQYKKLNDKQKAYAIQKLINSYNSLSKKQVLNEQMSIIEMLLNTKHKPTKEMTYLAEIDDIQANEKYSKKELIQKYINKLPMSKGEKYYLYWLSGYSINEDQKRLVRAFLMSKGITYQEARKMLK